MIKKEPRIEIVGNIDLELQPLLTDRSDDFGLTYPFVLRDPPLTLAVLYKEATRIDLERPVNVIEA